MKQPFFSSIFSVSSHHPFALPGKYKNVFPKGDIPILQSMAYTDMALRKFFDNAKTKPWFKNTLFVFTADHATVSNLPQYQTGIGNPVSYTHLDVYKRQLQYLTIYKKSLAAIFTWHCC